MKKTSLLPTLILVSVFAGIVAGGLLGEDATLFAPLGTLFLKLIKMLVIPLVAFSIITGAASVGNAKSAGKLGIYTFSFYISTTAVAVTIGLLFGNLFQPGLGLDMVKIERLLSGEFTDKGATAGFWQMLLNLVPENPIQALTEGNILQILFFSLFMGFAIASLKRDKKKLVLSFFHSITDALIWMIGKVMWTAPLGVFGLMADAVGSFGYEILSLVLKLFLVYIGALLIQTFLVYPLAVKWLSSTSPLTYINKISQAQLVALSTSSSMATLPVTLKVCENDLSVSNETASFVLPLGATINMDGNAVYYSLAAMFFAQMFGIQIGFQEYIAILLTATIGSIGQAGVPGPSLLVVAVLLAANIPVAGIPLLFGVDRLFDMLRTAVNISGDSACAIVVDNALNIAKNEP